uniref:7-cyano-7-deazaguanine synthase n=1 Tax=Magnetococcus massalia (strain MO-1) TaxID=451514 RepID=A0A1S7LL73_MAGMO|nr:Queuosine biosynthesis protein queC [Candidatus Magnetococcus massalia]
MPRSAVILLSGGLDSATVLHMAHQQGLQLYALSFRYGQRHTLELEMAAKQAAALPHVTHRVLDLNLSAFGGSALTDEIPVPKEGVEPGIPVTYVPARNTVFLSLALAWAETLGAADIFIGVNAIDYSGYPDCRPDFIHAFNELANLATREGVEGEGFKIHAPLIEMSKAEIIQTGLKLGVDYSLTRSCYDPDEKGDACGRCDACRLRLEGFMGAGISDPSPYQQR